MSPTWQHTQVDEYLSRSTTWPDEIAALRPILHDCGLVEDLKWRKPSSNCKGRTRDPDLVLVEELRVRLDGDSALHAAFTALTPGRESEYHLHFSSAKQASTRASRVDKYVPKILAGKGFATADSTPPQLEQCESLFVHVGFGVRPCYRRHMSSGTDELHVAIDSLLAVDPNTLTDNELHEHVTTIQRQRHRMAAAAAAAISAWDQRMVWADNGAGSAAVRLANDTSASPSSTGIEVKRARRLRTMPHVAAALAAGDLSVDHVDLLAKANQPWRNTSFADHEATLVEHCKILRFRDARKMIDYWCARADADAAEDQAERQRNAAHLDISSTLDGTVVVNGLLDPIGGAIVTNELNRLERELYLTDKRDGVIRTASQRRAAALVEMAARSATVPANGRRPKPLFTVLVGDHTMSQLCELSNGTVITPGSAFRYAGTADLEVVLFDGPTTVISVSHRRTFVGRLRRAVEVRDRHCQHTSGCDVPADQCDIGHIDPHASGGPTSQFNGKAECHPHNRNPDRHDHGGVSRPTRPIDKLDEIRCRLRWQLLREQPDQKPDDEPDDDAVDIHTGQSDVSCADA